MSYLLDTNAIIALLEGRASAVVQARKRAIDEVFLSAIVLHELAYGAYKSARREANVARLRDIPFAVLDFDTDAAEAAGRVRAYLAGLGTPIGPYDVLIAGHALARDLTLVTHNIREFERVPGLRLEDWEA